MNDRLIFDLGMNNGDDTDYYLKKGFSVVAVEANPRLCEACRGRFPDALATGRLRIVHAAVAGKSGELQLFLNEDVSGWSTTCDRWQQAREQARTQAQAVTVPAITVSDLVREHGTPYYIKADIQGAEIACLQSLAETPERPAYVSVSAGTDVLRVGAFEHVREQMRLLEQLGYDRFKIVAQQDTRSQSCPRPAREGDYVDHRFSHGSSGLFGRELPGEWIDAAAALAEHRRIVTGYKFAGHSRSPAARFTRIPSESLKYALDRLFWRGVGWYDTHAAR
jgi:FkbM family methyltransferase